MTNAGVLVLSALVVVAPLNAARCRQVTRLAVGLTEDVLRFHAWNITTVTYSNVKLD